MEWGWNPDTIVATATAFAALAAAVAGVFAALSFTQLKRQVEEARNAAAHAERQADAATRQLRSAEQREERAQAERIAAWTVGDDERFELALANASRTPVYDLKIAMVLGTKAAPESHYLASIEVLPPTPAGAERREVEDHHQDRRRGWLKETGRSKNVLPIIEFVFRDASGKIWHRPADGKLEACVCGEGLPADWRRKDGSPVEKPTAQR